MDKENFRKLLGIAGFVIVSKSLIPSDLPTKVEFDSLQTESESNLVVKAFDFSGIPQLRIWNTVSSSVAGIYFDLLPSIVKIDSQV